MATVDALLGLFVGLSVVPRGAGGQGAVDPPVAQPPALHLGHRVRYMSLVIGLGP